MRCPLLLRSVVFLVGFMTAPVVRAAPIDPAASEIILDYQRTRALRDRLRRAIVHLAVIGRVGPGFDPHFAPRRTGAATFVRLPDGREVILASATLTAESTRLTLVRRSGQKSAARVVRTLDELGVVVLEAEDRAALRDIAPLTLSDAPAALGVGQTLFSLDNLASGFEVVAWGRVEETGEPPLTRLRVVGLRLTGGHPLVGAGGQIAGFCFRSVTPSRPVCFASLASDVLRALARPARAGTASSHPRSDASRTATDGSPGE